MLEKDFIDRLNTKLSNKVFKYTGELVNNLNVSFGYKLTLDEYVDMVSVGEIVPFLKVSVTIVKFFDERSEKIFKLILKDFKDINVMIESFFSFYYNFRSSIMSFLKNIDEDIRVKINNITLVLPENETLTESRMDRNAIRTIIRDIVTILKQNKKGNFYLPEDISDDRHVYSFINYPVELQIELTIEHSKKIDGFILNADYSTEDDTIEILIRYNPNTLNSQLYNIIGELNEIVAHEMEHGLQQYYNEFNLSVKAPKNPLKYYTQEFEIPAQVVGFKRLAKLRKLPFEDVVRDWFKTHQDIHKLKQSEQEIVIDKILNYKR